MATMWTYIPCEGMPAPRTYADIDAALAAVATHICEDVDADPAKRAAVAPLVLLPADEKGTSVVGSDAVVLFVDAHASVKGLPPNKMANMILTAAGQNARGELRGAVFLGRVRHDGLSGGGEATPQMVVERSWLEAAQAAYKAAAGTPPALEGTLAARLHDMVGSGGPAAPAKATSSPAEAAMPAVVDVSEGAAGEDAGGVENMAGAPGGPGR
jgi:hypothetical protein